MIDRWKSDAFENQKIAKEISDDLKNKLLSSPHHISGWRSNPSQKHKTIKINKLGLRSKEGPFNEKSCLIFGGSYAWGFGSSSNNLTLSYLLEKKFRNNKKIIHFINLAEQMHSSHEEMLNFIDTYETKPKICIFISGFNDISREYNNIHKTTKLTERWINFFRFGQSKGIISDRNIFKIIIKLIVRYFKPVVHCDVKDYEHTKIKDETISEKILEKKLNIINSLLFNKKTKVFHFFQPSIYFKKKPSEYEKKYIKFIGKERSNFDKKKTNILNKFLENYSKKVDNKIIFSDLSNIYNNYKKTIFFDKVHVTDNGYRILTDKIFDIIKKDL